MKKIIIIYALISFIISTAQDHGGMVGINISTPERTLDINGNIRIRNLQDQSDNAEYNNVLITDELGNVEHVLRSDLLPQPDEFTADKEVVNNLYTNTKNLAEETKIITCGEFAFRFVNDYLNRPAIQFGLTQDPQKSINVYVSMEQNWSNDGFQLFQGNFNSSSISTSPFTLSKPVTAIKDSNGNITGYNNFNNFAENHLAPFEQNVIHLQYPENKNLYRLTVYYTQYNTTSAADNTTITKYDYISACEKF